MNNRALDVYREKTQSISLENIIVLAWGTPFREIMRWIMAQGDAVLVLSKNICERVHTRGTAHSFSKRFTFYAHAEAIHGRSDMIFLASKEKTL